MKKNAGEKECREREKECERPPEAVKDRNRRRETRAGVSHREPFQNSCREPVPVQRKEAIHSWGA